MLCGIVAKCLKFPEKGIINITKGENGSWACKSGDLMQAFIDEELKNMTVLNERLSLASSLQADKAAELDQDRKSTRLNSSHITRSRMPSSA